MLTLLLFVLTAEAGSSHHAHRDFAAARALCIGGGLVHATGWALVAADPGSSDLDEVGFGLASLGLPVTALGTLVQANALDGVGEHVDRTAATAALSLGVGAAGVGLPLYAPLGETTQGEAILFISLSAASFGLSVTQFVVNEVRYDQAVHNPRVSRVSPVSVEVLPLPEGGAVRLSGSF